MRSILPILSIVGLGVLLSSVACDPEPEPVNKCVEFLQCYAECRDENGIPDEDGSLIDGPGTDDHQRCYAECENGAFNDPSLFWFYPLNNDGGYTWGKIAACLSGEQL